MNFTENHFDTVFKNKEVQDYSLDPEKLKGKDLQVLSLLKKTGVAGAHCLDVGPGTGRWLSFLRQLGARNLAAVDISKQSLERCRRWCDAVFKIDIENENLPFPSNTFDIIISFEVLEHLIHPELFITEMLRVVKPGGLVLMTTPNLCSFASRVRMLFGGRPVAMAADSTHLRFYRKKDIARLFRQFEEKARFLPTGFSVNPLNPKSRYRIPTTEFMSSLDDSLVFCITPASKKLQR